MPRTLQTDTPAHLHHLHVVSHDPERLAAFYMKQMDLRPLASADSRIVLAGPGRAVEISDANDGLLPYTGYAVDSPAQLQKLKERLARPEFECAAAANR